MSNSAAQRRHMSPHVGFDGAAPGAASDELQLNCTARITINVAICMFTHVTSQSVRSRAEPWHVTSQPGQKSCRAMSCHTRQQILDAICRGHISSMCTDSHAAKQFPAYTRTSAGIEQSKPRRWGVRGDGAGHHAACPLRCFVLLAGCRAVVTGGFIHCVGHRCVVNGPRGAGGNARERHRGQLLWRRLGMTGLPRRGGGGRGDRRGAAALGDAHLGRYQGLLQLGLHRAHQVPCSLRRRQWGQALLLSCQRLRPGAESRLELLQKVARAARRGCGLDLRVLRLGPQRLWALCTQRAAPLVGSGRQRRLLTVRCAWRCVLASACTAGREPASGSRPQSAPGTPVMLQHLRLHVPSNVTER